MIRVRQDVDLLQRLKNAGFNTGRVRRERIFGQDTLTRMRRKQRLTMGELEAVCRLLGGQPGDYIEYVPDTVGVGDVGSGGAEARAAGDEAEAEAQAEVDAQGPVVPDFVYRLSEMLWHNSSDKNYTAWRYLHQDMEYAATLEDDYKAIMREPWESKKCKKGRMAAIKALEAKIIAHMEAEGRAERGSADGAGDLSPGDGGTV